MKTPIFDVLVQELFGHKHVVTHKDCTQESVCRMMADTARYNVISVTRLDVSLEERTASVLSFYGEHDLRNGRNYID